MNETTFWKNYIKIYFWRIFSVLTGFFSLLIVIPQLSLNKELYGIYTFCLSFNLYLTYADIGFLSAGQKYAAEEYAIGNRDSEIRYLGFTGFVLLCMVIPFSFIMVYLSFRPEYIISNLSDVNSEIISKMLLIMGVVSPFQIILQRLSQSILIVRIKDYISLRIDIIFNCIKILSVYYFFTETTYLVFEYFLFTNLLTIVSSIIIIIYIHSSENYNFGKLLKAIKFDKQCYSHIKKLAFATLLMTLSWLLYYELDLLFIGKLLGPKEVAVYAISFSVLNFLRNLWNIIYGPFAQRFNHYVGLTSFSRLKAMTFKLMNYTFPICVISVLILLISAKYLIISWVGLNYVDSILIFQILLMGTLFNFINQPASYYFISTTNYWFLNLNAIVLPIVFLLSLYFFVPIFGIKGFAIAKILALATGAIISFWGVRKLVNLTRIIKEWYLSLFVNSIILFVGLNFVFRSAFDTIEKGKSGMLMLFGIILFAIVIVFITTLFFHKSLRGYILTQLKNVLNKKAIA
jgi:O-antigen/teichoic acid export membrane protein